MENPFLNRSSAILGILLAVSPFASAENSSSALDNPEILKHILSLVSKKAESSDSGIDREYRLGDSNSLNNPAVLGSILKMVPKTPLKTGKGDPDAINDGNVLAGIIGLLAAPDSDAAKGPAGDPEQLNNQAIMQSLMGMMSQIDTGNSSLQDVNSTNALLNDPAILQGILPLIAAGAPGVTDEIFEPTPRTFTFVDDVPQRYGMLGLSLGQQTSSSFGDAALLGASFRYHLTDRWDAMFISNIGMTQLGNPEITNDSGTRVLLDKNESFYSFAAGASYGLLKGITSFNGKEYLPWQLSTDFLVGEQYTGNSHGLYLSVGASMSIMFDEYWVGTETRYYQVDDEILNEVGQHRGLQWSIAVGFYY